jgi:hypothetical protein
MYRRSEIRRVTWVGWSATARHRCRQFGLRRLAVGIRHPGDTQRPLAPSPLPSRADKEAQTVRKLYATP